MKFSIDYSEILPSEFSQKFLNKIIHKCSQITNICLPTTENGRTGFFKCITSIMTAAPQSTVIIFPMPHQQLISRNPLTCHKSNLIIFSSISLQNKKILAIFNEIFFLKFFFLTLIQILYFLKWPLEFMNTYYAC